MTMFLILVLLFLLFVDDDGGVLDAGVVVVVAAFVVGTAVRFGVFQIRPFHRRFVWLLYGMFSCTLNYCAVM